MVLNVYPLTWTRSAQKELKGSRPSLVAYTNFRFNIAIHQPGSDYLGQQNRRRCRTATTFCFGYNMVFWCNTRNIRLYL